MLWLVKHTTVRLALISNGVECMNTDILLMPRNILLHKYTSMQYTVTIMEADTWLCGVMGIVLSGSCIVCSIFTYMYMTYVLHAYYTTSMYVLYMFASSRCMDTKRHNKGIRHYSAPHHTSRKGDWCLWRLEKIALYFLLYREARHNSHFQSHISMKVWLCTKPPWTGKSDKGCVLKFSVLWVFVNVECCQSVVCLYIQSTLDTMAEE